MNLGNKGQLPTSRYQALGEQARTVRRPPIREATPSTSLAAVSMGSSKVRMTSVLPSRLVANQKSETAHRHLPNGLPRCRVGVLRGSLAARCPVSIGSSFASVYVVAVVIRCALHR
jgi:hypothetical protein